tara:strand:+ start:490 stop:879 length:390 start_codon:yes stop_codon:yes gene_type:complete
VKLKLVRVSEYKDATLGVLCLDARPMFVTLEDRWFDNERLISCIPAGKYKIRLHDSPKFGRVYQVCDVPERSHILIHAGNTKEDTHGCILLGLMYGTLGTDTAILSSRAALANFMTSMAGIEEAELQIV